jgi:hypothetical protein
VGLRGHGEAALGLEEGEELEPEGLEREERSFFFERERTKPDDERRNAFKGLSLHAKKEHTCAPARSPLRSACSAPNSSDRSLSPLAARAAADDEVEEGEESIICVAA